MKTVLITGANNGLGFSLLNEFIANGCSVIGVDLQTDNLENVKSKFVSYYKGDVTSLPDLMEVANSIEKVDLLICNAGIIDFFPLIEDVDDRLKRILDVNFHGAVNSVKAFSDKLIEAQGRVLFISSESVVIPGCFQPYQISKIALEGYVNSVRQELLMKGVQTAIIRPSAIKTDVLHEVSKIQAHPESDYANEFKLFANNAAKRVGKVHMPSEVAKRIFSISEKRKLKAIYRIKNKMTYRIFARLPKSFQDKTIIKILSKK
jgi:3-oxoacyl-[acyl-carrier protein] reductase